MAAFEREERGAARRVEEMDRRSVRSRARRRAARARRGSARAAPRRARGRGGRLTAQLARTRQALAAAPSRSTRPATSGPLRLLFAASGLRDFLARVRALRGCSRRDGEQLALTAPSRARSRAREARERRRPRRAATPRARCASAARELEARARREARVAARACSATAPASARRSPSSRPRRARSRRRSRRSARSRRAPRQPGRAPLREPARPPRPRRLRGRCASFGRVVDPDSAPRPSARAWTSRRRGDARARRGRRRGALRRLVPRLRPARDPRPRRWLLHRLGPSRGDRGRGRGRGRGRATTSVRVGDTGRSRARASTSRSGGGASRSIRRLARAWSQGRLHFKTPVGPRFRWASQPAPHSALRSARRRSPTPCVATDPLPLTFLAGVLGGGRQRVAGARGSGGDPLRGPLGLHERDQPRAPDYVEGRRDELVRGAVRGMLAELDPHSSFLDADATRRCRSTPGRVPRPRHRDQQAQDGFIEVVAPIEGTPAARPASARATRSRRSAPPTGPRTGPRPAARPRT